MSLAYIGRFPIDVHLDPTFDWSSGVTRHGLREATIGGRALWTDAKALAELAANDENAITVFDATGVLIPVWFSDELLRELGGVCLLVGAALSAAQPDSLMDHVPITLSLVAVPAKYALVVSRSARVRRTLAGVTPRAQLVQPFWGDEPTGEPFPVDPGGAAFSREYDHRTEYDPASLVPESDLAAMWDDPSVTWDDPIATWEYTGRRLRIHQGEVSG